MLKPELVAPAGNLEKLKVAFQYGADAVYLGTAVFGLRKYSDNFNFTELKIACQIAKKYQKKVYLVLNGFAYNSDLVPVKKFLTKIKNLDLHGLVISDLGIFKLAKDICNFPLHVSTQISTTNEYAVNFWAEAGAKRSMLARQLSIKEIAKIRKRTNQELEVFIHGANCAGFAGHCVLSNYTSARDANRGGCVQNCRHLFNLYDKHHNLLGSDYFMNTKDLCLASLIPQLIKLKINAFKIEGRMKSNFYLATVVSNYRFLIDYCYEQLLYKKPIDDKILDQIQQNLAEVSNRPFLTESKTKVVHHGENILSNFSYIGLIREIDSGKWVYLDVKNPFKIGDNLEFIAHNGKIINFVVKEILNLNNEQLNNARINQLVKLAWQDFFFRFGVLRKKKTIHI